MVGVGFGDDLVKVFYIVLLIGVLIGGGTCFGLGYAYRGCESRPHIEFSMKKVK